MSLRQPQRDNVRGTEVYMGLAIAEMCFGSLVCVIVIFHALRIKLTDFIYLCNNPHLSSLLLWQGILTGIQSGFAGLSRQALLV